MRKLFGYTLFTKREIELQERLAAQEKEVIKAHLSVQTERANKAYEEVEFYRGKYEEMMERADRQLDVFMNSVGMPEVTTTTKKENIQKEKKQKDKWKERENELAELYGETVNTLHDMEGLELTPELQEESDRLMAEMKSESEVEEKA